MLYSLQYNDYAIPFGNNLAPVIKVAELHHMTLSLPTYLGKIIQTVN